MKLKRIPHPNKRFIVIGPEKGTDVPVMIFDNRTVDSKILDRLRQAYEMLSQDQVNITKIEEYFI